MTHHLALIGFGTVGQALVEILRERGKVLQKQGLDIQVDAVSDPLKGSLYHPEGLDLNLLLQAEKKGHLDSYPEREGLQRGWNSFKTIEDTDVDTVVEVSYTDIQTGQPAIDHCRRAFQSGKNVVMTNKGPVALAYHELSKMARDYGVDWKYEGTVMSGTPVIRTARSALVGNEITEIRGIFNGTTNYMLSQMEKGIGFSEALESAQSLGMAEADPTSDIEGYDVLYKVMILAQVVMGITVDRDKVIRKGIRDLSPEMIRQSLQEEKRWKMVGSIRRKGDQCQVAVQPVLLPFSDPLSGIGGAMNGVTFECDLAGPITVVGAGAGRRETGYALLSDLIHLIREEENDGIRGEETIIRQDVLEQREKVD